jgi:glycosyltransferase involved in cell wall biosynthesis
MRLLVITQVVDTQDTVLGAYVRWLEELSARFDSLEVICLREGSYILPENVRVHSLGKEKGANRLQYIYRLYCYAWKYRCEYDAVFVHMNQEYILLAGLLWKALRKPIYLWRNHYAGSWLTDLAAVFCKKVFCTSKYSYTAKFKKTILMPVGIEVGDFEDSTVIREPRSILFLARMASSKRPEMLIDALGDVLARGISFTASFYGSPVSSDVSYYESLQARAESLGLRDRVQFHSGIPHEKTPAVYHAHDISVNCSPSGMFDKTLFEAAAAGCRVIAASDDFRDAAGDESYAPDTESLTERLIEALTQDEDAILRRRIQMQVLARGESLGTLADVLSREIAIHVH